MQSDCLRSNGGTASLDSIPKKKRAKLVTDLEKVLDTPARLEQLTFFSGEE